MSILNNAVINYAHRGASGNYPENTMLAFAKAVEMGCDGIETDVQMTRDGVLVLIHDERVDRTTNGSGLVKDYSYAELCRLDAGLWYGASFAGAGIPRAEELLLLARDAGIRLNFEIKNGIVQYEFIEEKLIELIYSYGWQDLVILSSFNHYSMVHCKEIAPSLKTGLLYMEGLYRPGLYARTARADALHPYFYAVNEEIICEAHSEGLLVNTFTINDPAAMRRLVQTGVDGIITNYPDRLRSVMAELNCLNSN
ncbi:glycerophosphodiester phosphodiesterase [Desulfosporosinus youngiae]|uniref:Glycerophosphoryl diester phosphodiesterase n=1 Tax=Desulfosporosinus youngiae DSM 17734 TaxID=768710 RepID=H5Y5Y2_9FIRM|nr:glycerophosphodiester phosphodiesterase [Desulfosporosinus youngiae]EHQ90921.1 glycerophosphoryl diester phosphodiesterase [Desulfosporosinus youngiae DSM 17734]